MTRVIDIRRGIMLLAAAVAAAAVAVVSLSADDAGALLQCPNRHFCVYEDTNLGGQQVKMGPEKGLTNKIAEKMNNEASSASSIRGKVVILYAGKNGRGESICIDPNESKMNFAEDSFDNLASSAKLTKRSSCLPG